MLEPLWQQVCSTGRGGIVRLRGSTEAAMAFAQHHAPLESLAVAQLPDDQPTFVWVHGDAAAIGAADQLSVALVCAPKKPWLVLLTGAAAEIGGIRGVELACFDHEGATTKAYPTRIDHVFDGATANEMRQAARLQIKQDGDRNLALLAYALLGFDQAMEFVDLEIERLMRLGWTDPAEELAVAALARGFPPSRLRLQRALQAQSVHDLEGGEEFASLLDPNEVAIWKATLNPSHEDPRLPTRYRLRLLYVKAHARQEGAYQKLLDAPGLYAAAMALRVRAFHLDDHNIPAATWSWLLLGAHFQPARTTATIFFNSEPQLDPAPRSSTPLVARWPHAGILPFVLAGLGFQPLA